MFTEPGVWRGGSIELLCLFSRGGAERRRALCSVVWAWSHLAGPYRSSSVEPSMQVRCEPTDEAATYGVASLPGQLGSVAFKVSFVEDENGLWLYAGVPLGSLGKVLPVGAFPFGEPVVQHWEHTVYAWLFGLAEHVHSQVPFECGVIGWLTLMEVEELAERRVPEQRSHGYIASAQGKLLYYAPNRKEALLE